jgi:hypothetical protein
MTPTQQAAAVASDEADAYAEDAARTGGKTP